MARTSRTFWPAMRDSARVKAELSVLVPQKPNIEEDLYLLRTWLHSRFYQSAFCKCFALTARHICFADVSHRKSYRPISNGQLHALLHFHLHPIYPVLFRGSPGLLRGYLILGPASRLDAFSVYPFRIWLPCYGVGRQQVHQ